MAKPVTVVPSTKWTEAMLVELSELFHLGRAVTSSRYEAKLWASREYAKRHPEVSSTAAYKALCREEAWRY